MTSEVKVLDVVVVRAIVVCNFSYGEVEGEVKESFVCANVKAH